MQNVFWKHVSIECSVICKYHFIVCSILVLNVQFVGVEQKIKSIIYYPTQEFNQLMNVLCLYIIKNYHTKKTWNLNFNHPTLRETQLFFLVAYYLPYVLSPMIWPGGPTL